jgi:hypothetical protein
VNKPVPVENIALDASASHISRRSQILVDVLATQTNPSSSRKRDMSIGNLEINLISERRRSLLPTKLTPTLFPILHRGPGTASMTGLGLSKTGRAICTDSPGI